MKLAEPDPMPRLHSFADLDRWLASSPVLAVDDEPPAPPEPAPPPDTPPGDADS